MKHIRSTFFLLTTLFIMASCGEDRSGEYYALIGENVWIEQIMKEHYLWYDSIPAIKETDYFAEPEDFLQKLVYTKAQNGKGDPYSYIETKETSDAARSYLQRTSTYGFDFELMTVFYSYCPIHQPQKPDWNEGTGYQPLAKKN